MGDLVRLGPGDQVVADGPLLAGVGLHLDESILTGEANAGRAIRGGRGSVGLVRRRGHGVVRGRCRRRRELRRADRRDGPRVPPSALAARARDRPPPLRAARGDGAARGDADRGARAKQDVAMRHAVDTAVAGMVTLIPEGLILLVSVTYAAAALRMARAGALSQQLNAIESLASVDTICIDKTGTLTEASLRLVALAAGGRIDRGRSSETALGRFAAASEAPNPTLAALARALPGASRACRRGDPLPLAAPLERAEDRRRPLRPRRAGALPARRSRRPGCGRAGGGAAGGRLRHDERRGSRTTRTTAHRRCGRSVSRSWPRSSGRETRETIAYLVEQGVEIVVLSGDAARTAGSIASDAGIPVRGPPLDGEALPAGDADLDRRLVDALGRRTDLAGRQAARRRVAAAGAAATWRWSETASTTCRR